MNRIPPAPDLLTSGRITAMRAVVERTAHEAVPLLADFCIVHLKARGALAAVTGAHATRTGDRNLRALIRGHRVRLNDLHSTVAHVVRTGDPVLRRVIPPDPQTPSDPNRLETLLRRLAPHSALVVPIAVGKTVLGTVSLCFSESRRSYSARHLGAARRLAARIAEILLPDAPEKVPIGLRGAVRHARQGTLLRRREAARN
jgi:GAF domain-containing protein